MNLEGKGPPLLIFYGYDAINYILFFMWYFMVTKVW